MSISVNGQSVVPPGFRFHPTEEELLTYYLKKKVASERIDLDVIRDVDLNKLEPWDIQERCKIGSGLQNDWYFFSHKDKKYPTGTRTNRATAAGFWKATGRDKAIYSTSTASACARLSFSTRIRGGAGDQAAQEEGWVICRVFKKKNLLHHGQSSSSAATAATSHTAATMAAAMNSSPPSNCSSVTVSDHVKAQMLHSASDDTLDHILLYMGRSCKQETKPSSTSAAAALDHLTPPSSTYGKFLKLPPLEHVAGSDAAGLLPNQAGDYSTADALGIADWDTLDRFTASYELNTLPVDVASKNMVSSFFNEPTAAAFYSVHDGNGDLWSLARSVSSLHADTHFGDE
ncbi:hypothetical protein GUJ93_ZPchr0006g45530 [Zizania palustris]|uniref:NAC domain-containing protein n=1 Tax=Zizania palustris TaxID=103762 RepID=A0A8J5SN44_ZIZPA|nr:hypothetical protein GUJ93_ZPchr0006g45530 [Zizania palustris]